MKQCTKCKENKDSSLFSKDKSRSDGLFSWCKKCKADNDAKQHKKHREKRIKQMRQSYQKNKEEINEKRRNNLAAKEKDRLYKKEFRKQNPDKIKEWKKNYYQKHKTDINRKFRDRRRIDLKFRMSNNLRSRLYHAMKGEHKSSSTWSLIGCSFEELKAHLSSKFTEGMTWDNYGSEWSIDHIVPCCNFDLTSEEAQKSCFGFANLQPLWKLDNYKKNKF